MSTTLDPQLLTVALAAWRSAEAYAIDERALPRILAGEPSFLGAFALPAADGGAADEGYCIEAGVAVVPIQGALMTTGSSYGWWDGYDTIAQRVQHAHQNPAARAVVLAITSPGGMVAGMFEGMRALRAARTASGKRMVAWVGSAGFSAAYGLASTCDEIVVDELAGVGSVGVIDGMVSQLGRVTAEGVDVRVIASGSEKTDGHPYVAITPEAEARKRARVTELAQAFAREIHAGRPALTPDAALALDGGIRFGRAALAVGLADRVSTRAALLAELAGAKVTSGPRGHASTPTTRPPMSEKLLTTVAALTGEHDPDRQIGHLQATFAAAERAQKAEAALAAMTAEREAQEAAATKAAAGAAFDAALAKGQEEGKLTPAEAEQWRGDFAKGEVSIGVLEGNLARRAPIPALTQAHRDLRAPAAPVPTGAAVSAANARVGELVAKGYAGMSWDERNELAQLAATKHDELFTGWVAAGRPGAR